ncbi:putative 1-acyl-sn-glycerol-3-phosphate acyltransferase [Pillotina sp. SPG140]
MFLAMALLKTIGVFVITIVLLIVITFPCALIFLLSKICFKKILSLFLYRIAQWWAQIIIVCTRCPITVTGRDYIPKTGPLCFVSNHGSMFDIILMLAYAERPFGFIAKRELLLLPFINLWITMLGGIFIDRKNIRKAVKTIHQGVKHIQSGDCMLIFPEGTRSRGKGLLPFRAGALKLATQSGAVIVPVAISRSYEVFEKTYRVQVVPVRITFGEPVITAHIPLTERRQILTEQIRNTISSLLEV